MTILIPNNNENFLFLELGTNNKLLNKSSASIYIMYSVFQIIIIFELKLINFWQFSQGGGFDLFL